MDQAEIYIKRNITETREAMTEKITMLEHRIHRTVTVPNLTMDAAIENISQIKGSMEETRSAIDCGLETMTQSVEETLVKMESVAEHITQMGHNPWILLASAILMGYAAGSLNRAKLGVSHCALTQAEGSYR